MICKVVFDKIDYGNAYELFDMPPSKCDAKRICHQLTGKNPISKGNFMKEKKKER